MKIGWQFGLAAGLLSCIALPAQAVITGMVDTFQDGTMQQWNGGADAVIVTGGPAGPDDRFLQASSGDFGLPPHLAIFNEAPRWQGDYTAAGAVTLSADVKVLQGSAIELRAVLFGGSTGSSRATSTTAVTIPADGAWHHVSFDISAAGLSLVIANDPMDNLLASVNRIMLRHQSGPPDAGGTPVSAQVGFDNIVVTPEPGALLLMALGSLAAVRRRPGR